MTLKKTIIRKFLLPLALKIKVDKYFLNKTDKRFCIINFHGVRRDGTKPINNRHMPQSEFEKMIVYLKQNFQVVSLNEIFDAHRSKKEFTRKCIAITFDDGYLNNFEIAYPILKKHNIPATFYIITKCLVEENYIAWPDLIDIIKTKSEKDIVLNNYCFKSKTLWCEDLKMDLMSYIKTLGPNSESVANSLIADSDWIKHSISENSELIKVVDNSVFKQFINDKLVDFGSHTHQHLCLEYLNTKETENELGISKQILGQILDKPIKSHAFPDGSYNPDTIKIAEKLGYENLVAVDYKFQENNKLPNLLSRFTISNSTNHESNALRLAMQFAKYGF